MPERDLVDDRPEQVPGPPLGVLEPRAAQRLRAGVDQRPGGGPSSSSSSSGSSAHDRPAAPIGRMPGMIGIATYRARVSGSAMLEHLRVAGQVLVPRQAHRAARLRRRRGRPTRGRTTSGRGTVVACSPIRRTPIELELAATLVEEGDTGRRAGQGRRELVEQDPRDVLRGRGARDRDAQARQVPARLAARGFRPLLPRLRWSRGRSRCDRAPSPAAPSACECPTRHDGRARYKMLADPGGPGDGARRRSAWRRVLRQPRERVAVERRAGLERDRQPQVGPRLARPAEPLQALPEREVPVVRRRVDLEQRLEGRPRAGPAARS